MPSTLSRRVAVAAAAVPAAAILTACSTDSDDSTLSGDAGSTSMTSDLTTDGGGG